MNHRGILFTCGCVLILSTVLPRAALAQNNADLTINGFGTNITANPFIIGDTGTNNSFHVINGGSSTNVTSVLGYSSAAASNNFAIISGPGSLWTNTATGGEDGIVVGRVASHNSLVISNGATAVGQQVYSARFAGDFNTITVTGTNSLLLSHSSVVIGVSGHTNSLVVNSGGTLRSMGASEVSGGGGGSGNSALITGPGSAWDSTASLTIGAGASRYSRMIVSNGALVSVNNGAGVVSGTIGQLGTENEVIVTGAGSVWTNSGFLHIGYTTGSSSNRLTIANGGLVHANEGYWGRFAGGTNFVTVSGAGSRFEMRGDAIIGVLGSGGNSLTVTDGGKIANGIDGSGNAYLGLIAGVDNNVATISGPGSEWTSAGFLAVGEVTAGNLLVITNQGTVRVLDSSNAGDSLYVGRLAGSSNNVVRVEGGNLIVTNATSATPGIDVRRGAFVLNSGTVDTERFLASNGSNSVVQFNGGTLVTRGTTIANSNTFTVGDGVSVATLRLKGGTHSFADGLSISANATLSGTGTVSGATTVHGTLAPGFSPGKINFNDLTLDTNSNFSVELNGLTAGTQYDQADVTGAVVLSNGLLSVLIGFSPVLSNQFVIINNDGVDAVSGIFDGLTEGSIVSGGGATKLSISYVGGDGNDVVLTFLVPEPASVMLAAIGLGVVLRIRRR